MTFLTLGYQRQALSREIDIDYFSPFCRSPLQLSTTATNTSKHIQGPSYSFLFYSCSPLRIPPQVFVKEPIDYLSRFSRAPLHPSTTVTSTSTHIQGPSYIYFLNHVSPLGYHLKSLSRRINKDYFSQFSRAPLHPSTACN